MAHHEATNPAIAKGANHHQPVSGKARCRANAHTNATAVERTVVEVSKVRRLRAAVVVAAMMILSGCGHQVTGLNAPNGGLVPSGQTLIRFETAGPIDTTNFSYLIIFNTTGDGNAPVAQGYNSNYLDWSFGFLLGGGSNVLNAPTFIQYYQDPTGGSAGIPYIRPYQPQQLVFDTNVTSAYAPYGFEIRFDRCLFNLAAPTASNNPGPTPAPSPKPLGSICPPFDFTTTNPTWVINLFTVDNTRTVVDALTSVGTAKLQPLDTTQIVNDYAFAKPVGNTVPQSASAQIKAVEIFNTP